jgi:hypothetical protein
MPMLLRCRVVQDKNPDNRAAAETKFKDISEAYEVRSIKRFAMHALQLANAETRGSLLHYASLYSQAVLECQHVLKESVVGFGTAWHAIISLQQLLLLQGALQALLRLVMCFFGLQAPVLLNAYHANLIAHVCHVLVFNCYVAHWCFVL